MKVVILAGGFGTRLSEFTKTIPKPMVKIGKYPIIIHIINHYAHFNHKDFYIAQAIKVKLLKIISKISKKWRSFSGENFK